MVRCRGPLSYFMLLIFLIQMFQLIQAYYYYLSLGKFFEALMQSNDLSDLAFDLPITTGEKTYFKLRENLIQKLLKEIHQHPDQRNIFGYLTELSAFKGIFSVMRELIEDSHAFRSFLQEQLQDQYLPFEQLIRFLRNVLNHATSSSVSLKLDDYEKQLEYLLSPKIKNPIVDFNFSYHRYIRQWQGSKDYGIQVKIDFQALRPGMKLESVVEWHQLYLLSELCFNLAQIAELSNKGKASNIKQQTSSNKSQASSNKSQTSPKRSQVSSSKSQKKSNKKKQQTFDSSASKRAQSSLKSQQIKHPKAKNP